jgi:hypothetical protein
MFVILDDYQWLTLDIFELYQYAFGVEPHLITTIVSMFWVVLEEHSQHRSERGYRNYGYVDAILLLVYHFINLLINGGSRLLYDLLNDP